MNELIPSLQAYQRKAAGAHAAGPSPARPSISTSTRRTASATSTTRFPTSRSRRSARSSLTCLRPSLRRTQTGRCGSSFSHEYAPRPAAPARRAGRAAREREPAARLHAGDLERQSPLPDGARNSPPDARVARRGTRRIHRRRQSRLRRGRSRRRRLSASRTCAAGWGWEASTFVAWLGGEPVGVGAYTVPLDGFTELVGIATLPEYRRRGIAGAVTAEMARHRVRGGRAHRVSDRSRRRRQPGVPAVGFPAGRDGARVRRTGLTALF